MAYPKPGKGTSIAFGTLGTNATFTAFVRDITGPSFDRPAIDLSSNGSPTVAGIGDTSYNQLYREFDPGVCDPGEVSVDIVYNPNHQAPVNEPKEVITITYPLPFPGQTNNSASFASDGFCTGFENATPWEGEMTARMTLKLSGAPTYVSVAES